MLSHPSHALVRAVEGWDSKPKAFMLPSPPLAAKLPTDTGLISQSSQDLCLKKEKNILP